MNRDPGLDLFRALFNLFYLAILFLSLSFLVLRS